MTIPITPVNAVEIEDKDLMLAVEELVKVKMIERELVFGLPLEDAALLNNLNKGRDIEFVVEHFNKYYCEDVLKQYLYYLKRSTSQELYLSLGVFWGSDYAVVGNVYKRNAKEVKYNIEYQSIEEKNGITRVIVEVTPIYYGDYDFRGEKTTEFTDNKRMVTLFLSKENETYKLSELDKATIDEIEKEIGEPIDLDQEKDTPVYDKLNEFKYKNKQEKAGLYFTYDILSRLVYGGHDKLYDRYEELWLTQENKDYKGMLEHINLENLKIDYLGWDYAYFYEYEDFKLKSGDGIRKSDPYQKIDILLFNVDATEVKKIVMMESLTEEDIEFQTKIEALMEPFIPIMNTEVEMFMGSEYGGVFTLSELENEYDKYSLYGFDELNSMIFDNWNDVGVRFTKNTKIGDFVINNTTQEFSFSLPKGIPERDVYTDSKVVKIQSPFASEIWTFDKNNNKTVIGNSSVYRFRQSRKYNFDVINYILIDSTYGSVKEYSYDVSNRKDRIEFDYGAYRIEKILNMID